jgi:hypothetical protein
MSSPRKKDKKEEELESKGANYTTKKENPTNIGPGITERYKKA